MRARLALVLALVALAIPAIAAAKAPSQVPTFTALTLKDGGGEPNVSISPDGKTILVAGLGAGHPAVFFRSTDAGISFRRIEPRFDRTGGGDWDMRWLDNRTLVAVDLGDGILVHRSTDAGSTWTTTSIDMEVYDRPWIDHFGSDLVYVVAKGWEGIPYLYVSRDGGRSFGEPPIPIVVYGTSTTPTPVEAFTGGLNAYVDHLAVDPTSGEVYVLYGLGAVDSFDAENPIGIANRLYLARLSGGAFTSTPVLIGDADDAFISGFNWLAVDARGTLYALANGTRDGVHHSLWLTSSKDRGATWSSPRDLGARGAANVFGSIAAGSPGTLSLVYLRGTKEDPAEDQDWYAEMARVAGADSPSPVVHRSRPVNKPVHREDICFDGILCGLPGFGDNRALLDFVWNAVTPDGAAFAVLGSDGPATGDTAGNVSILLLRQTGGIRHGRGAPS